MTQEDRRDPLNSDLPNWPLLAAVRFVLALIVASYHLATIEDPVSSTVLFLRDISPTACVAAFLMLSGYSIASSIRSVPEGFLWRRFWRIYPTFAVTLVFSLLPFLFCPSPIIPGDGWECHAPEWREVIGQFLLLFPLAVPVPGFNPPLWSLGVEVAFYVLAPLLARLHIRWTWLFTGLSAWYLHHYGFSFPHALGAGVHASVFVFFGFGWLWQHYEREEGELREWVALAVIVLPGLLVMETSGLLGRYAWLAVAGTALMLVRGSLLTVNKKAAPILLYLGDLSFPLYIGHIPAGYLLWLAGVREYPLFLLASLAVAVLLLHAVDRPLRRLGHKEHWRLKCLAARA